MAICCRCGADLPGRRQLCDGCKAKKVRTRAEKPADLAEAEEVTAVIDAVPTGLHQRGRQLWIELGQHEGTAAGEIALEACRLADRLNELDRIIAGKGVLQLMKFRLSPSWWDSEGDEHVHVKVGFQSVLSEARMQAAAFKELLKELRVISTASQKPGTAKSPAPAAPPSATVPAGVASILQRRADRERQAT